MLLFRGQLFGNQGLRSILWIIGRKHRIQPVSCFISVTKLSGWVQEKQPNVRAREVTEDFVIRKPFPMSLNSNTVKTFFVQDF